MKNYIKIHETGMELKPEFMKKLYKDLLWNGRIGFEIETANPYEPEHNRITALAREFECDIGGDSVKTKPIDILNIRNQRGNSVFNEGIKGNQKFHIRQNSYNTNEVYTRVYRDCTVDYEVVTNLLPVNDEIGNVVPETIKRVRDVTGDSDNTDCLLGCGMHMTFGVKGLKVTIPYIVSRNVIQIVRGFGAGLYYALSCGSINRVTRDSEYRRLNYSIHSNKNAGEDKYRMVHTKNGSRITLPDGANALGNHSLIEFRLWDSVPLAEMNSLMACITKAIILKAVRLSEFGVIKFDSELFKKYKWEYLKLIDNGEENTFPREDPDRDDDEDEWFGTSYKSGHSEKLCKENIVMFSNFIREDLMKISNNSEWLLNKLIIKPLWKVAPIRMDRVELSNWRKAFNKVVSTNHVYDFKITGLLNSTTEFFNNRKACINWLKKELGVKESIIKKALKQGYSWNPKLGRYIELNEGVMRDDDIESKK